MSGIGTEQEVRGLDEVAHGELPAAEARRILSACFSELNEVRLRSIYAALKAWTWRAVNERRRDSELREWYSLIHQISVKLHRMKHDVWAARMEVLYEMVDESISVNEVFPLKELSKRSHVRQLLETLRSSPGGRCDRVSLGERLGLAQANLSRVLGLLVSTNLIERQRIGREAWFHLTAAGRELAESVQGRPEPSDRSRPETGIVHSNGRYLAVDMTGPYELPVFYSAAQSGAQPKSLQQLRTVAGARTRGAIVRGDGVLDSFRCYASEEKESSEAFGLAPLYNLSQEHLYEENTKA